MAVELKRCQFVIPAKKRPCRLLAKPDKRYCGEHCAYDETDNRDRIPCPNDPKHTVTRLELADHLANRCNSRVTVDVPWISVNCNVSNPTKSMQFVDSDDSKMEERIARIRQRIEKTYEKFSRIPEFKESILQTAIIEEILNNPAESVGEIRRKQLTQQGSIIGNLLSAGLLSNRDDHCIVEFGAGKAQLMYYIAKLVPSCRFVLIDRAGSRNKHDNKARQENEKLSIRRIRCSLEHLNLNGIGEPLTNCRTVTIIWKHFCGDATDYGIRCLKNAMGTLPVKGFAVAPCCCHKSTFDEYCGKKFLSDELDITDSIDFAAVRHIATWAVCGFRTAPSGTIEQPGTVINGDDDTSFTNWSSNYKEALGRKAKFILEMGRVRHLQEQLGFDVDMVRYVDREVTPENLLIIGRRK